MLSFFDVLRGLIQDRRSIFSAAALVFGAGTAGALRVSGDLGRAWRRRRCRRCRATKRTQAGFAVALGELVFGEGHEGVHIGRALRRRGRGWFGSWVLVRKLFLDGAPFLELAEFIKGAAEDEVGLRAGAIDGFLLLFGAFVDHGVEVQIVY